MNLRKEIRKVIREAIENEQTSPRILQEDLAMSIAELKNFLLDKLQDPTYVFQEDIYDPHSGEVFVEKGETSLDVLETAARWLGLIPEDFIEHWPEESRSKFISQSGSNKRRTRSLFDFDIVEPEEKEDDFVFFPSDNVEKMIGEKSPYDITMQDYESELDSYGDEVKQTLLDGDYDIYFEYPSVIKRKDDAILTVEDVSNIKNYIKAYNKWLRSLNHNFDLIYDFQKKAVKNAIVGAY